MFPKELTLSNNDNRVSVASRSFSKETVVLPSRDTCLSPVSLSRPVCEVVEEHVLRVDHFLPV